jgi:uncharacterized membrane protein
VSRKEFLKTLELSLQDFTDEERKDILYDYEEHFRIGTESGKTDEELISELCTPENIANQYRANYSYERVIINETTENTKSEELPKYKEYKTTAEDVSISVIAAISLIFFNLVFILGPFLGLTGALAGLFAAAIGLTLGGAGLTLGPIFYPIFNYFGNLPTDFPFDLSILFGIGTTALGILFFIGDCYIAKYFFKGTVKYVSWNLNIIKRKA